MLKRRFLRLLFWLVDRTYPVSYLDINRDTIEQWLYDSYGSKGLENYFKLEDYKVLKALGTGLDEKNYWIMLGRRIQLLYLYDEARRVFNNRKSQEQKKVDEAARQKQNE